MIDWDLTPWATLFHIQMKLLLLTKAVQFPSPLASVFFQSFGRYVGWKSPFSWCGPLHRFSDLILCSSVARSLQDRPAVPHSQYFKLGNSKLYLPAFFSFCFIGKDFDGSLLLLLFYPTRISKIHRF